MGLRDKYQQAIQTAKGHMEGSADELDGKLYFHGTVQTDQEKNAIWDAIKTVPSWNSEVVADIKVSPAAPAVSGQSAPSPSSETAKTYTVKAGDTLSRIAKEMLGNANAYTDIFNANRDQLSDPNKIKPGQVLKMPQTKH